MNWLILISIIVLNLVVGIGLFRVYEQLIDVRTGLQKAIENAHAQVINNEKITRIVLDMAEKSAPILSKVSDNNTDIHNVCIMVAKEIQAAKEAQKRA